MKSTSLLVGVWRDLRSRASIGRWVTVKGATAWTLVAAALLSISGCVRGVEDKRAGRPLNDLEREVARRRGTIQLPDLRPRSAHGTVFGENVSIRVKVRNQGRGGADTFQVVAEVGRVFGQSFNSTVPRLGIGDEWEEEVGVVRVPVAGRPTTIDVRVIVDPVTPGAPRGRQLETNEANNEGNYTITVF